MSASRTPTTSFERGDIAESETIGRPFPLGGEVLAPSRTLDLNEENETLFAALACDMTPAVGFTTWAKAADVPLKTLEPP